MAGLDESFPQRFRNESYIPGNLNNFPCSSENNFDQQNLKWRRTEPINVNYPLLVKSEEINCKVATVNLKYFRTSLHLLSAFCENVLAHPFVVLKRQCQVNPNGRKLHIIPITLIPIIFRIQSRQGLGTLWKGIGSMFIVRGLVIVFEDVLNKLTQWPKDTKNVNSVKKLFDHLFLKFISSALVTPFYSACLIETVQSDIASEKPKMFDCLVEGVVRAMPSKSSSTSRLLSVWKLAFPTAAYSLCHYTISTIVQRGISLVWRSRRSNQNKDDETSETDNEYIELSSYFLGHLVSDVVLYPCETVLNRLHVQGTRTIIDNLDSGYEVTPIITKYEGVMDCFETVRMEEHASGFFKGIGTIALQYAIYFAVLKVTRLIFDELKFGRPRQSPLINKI